MTKEEIKELKGLAASMGLYDDRNPCKRAVILGKAIKALEQEPKTGHWMIVEDSINLFFATYECSCCKRAIIVPHDAMKAVYKNYPYCHCGTKMVEPQERGSEN